MERLQPLHRRVAGIDVHRMLHVVTVVIEQSDGSIEQTTREFGGFRRDCRALAAWLSELRVELVVMESTGSTGRACMRTKRNIRSTMPVPTSRKELTHDRILDVAARAIRRAGYDGVGLATIMKEAGLTHGGFYAHFASRDALLAEATQRAGRDTGSVLVERLRQAQADGMSPFSALVNTYLADAQLENTECGCMVAALASEIPRQAEEVAGAARARVLGLVEFVRRTLPAGVDPARAQVVAATMVGTLQLARTLQGKAGKAWLANVRASLIQQYDA